MYVRKKEMAQNNKIVCLNKTKKKKMKEIKKKEVKDNFSKSYMDTVKKLSNSVDKKIKRKVTRESINGEKEEGYMFPFMQSEIEETENYSLDKTNYVKKAPGRQVATDNRMNPEVAPIQFAAHRGRTEGNALA